MDVREMRRWLSSQYPGVRWHERVARMPTKQIIAIYRSMQSRKNKIENRAIEPDGYHQIDLFEWLAEKEA